MSVAFLEPFAGIAGDMTVAALLDLGLPLDELRATLAKLPIEGYRIDAERVRRGAFAGTRFLVEVEEEQPHRNLADIREILDSGALSPATLERSLSAFERIAAAEARAHDRPVDEVHFHEVGGIDSIVDVVGAAFGLEHFGVDRIVVGPVRVGTGEVTCRHGRIPVPAPATLELLSGFRILLADGEGETTTPTGASFLAAWAEPLPPEFPFTPERTGYGAGARDDTALPNLLRVTIGQTEDGAGDDTVVELVANLDDQAPETVAFAAERALAAGALDAWIAPVLMKKGRPGHVLHVLIHEPDADSLEELLFRETTTFGVRRSRHTRRILARRHETVETPFGPVRVKIGRLGDEDVTFSPEYEDCARLARERGVPLRDVYASALRALS